LKLTKEDLLKAVRVMNDCVSIGEGGDIPNYVQGIDDKALPLLKQAIKEAENFNKLTQREIQDATQ